MREDALSSRIYNVGENMKRTKKISEMKPTFFSVKKRVVQVGAKDMAFIRAISRRSHGLIGPR